METPLLIGAVAIVAGMTLGFAGVNVLAQALPSRVARYEAWLSPSVVKRHTVTVRGRNRRLWVIRVGLTRPRRLPVYPGERTFSG